MVDFRTTFLQLALDLNALRFGSFTLKSGRISPYFFNAGAFHSGRSLAGLGHAYAHALLESGLPFDQLYGPAYKGIPLATATACALLALSRDVPVTFNRKEAKDHGEGGLLIGAPLAGKVWIVDDVVSAGTSVRESVAIIRAAGAEVGGVLIALDRQERGAGADAQSATQEIRTQFGIPVLAVLTLSHLLDHVLTDPALAGHADALAAYRERYGAG